MLLVKDTVPATTVRSGIVTANRTELLEKLRPPTKTNADIFKFSITLLLENDTVENTEERLGTLNEISAALLERLMLLKTVVNTGNEIVVRTLLLVIEIEDPMTERARSSNLTAMLLLENVSEEPRYENTGILTETR